MKIENKMSSNQFELSTESPKPGVSTIVKRNWTPFSFKIIDDESIEIVFFFLWTVDGKSCP